MRYDQRQPSVAPLAGNRTVARYDYRANRLWGERAYVGKTSFPWAAPNTVEGDAQGLPPKRSVGPSTPPLKCPQNAHSISRWVTKYLRGTFVSLRPSERLWRRLGGSPTGCFAWSRTHRPKGCPGRVPILLSIRASYRREPCFWRHGEALFN